MQWSVYHNKFNMTYLLAKWLHFKELDWAFSAMNTSPGRTGIPYHNSDRFYLQYRNEEKEISIKNPYHNSERFYLQYRNEEKEVSIKNPFQHFRSCQIYWIVFCIIRCILPQVIGFGYIGIYTKCILYLKRKLFAFIAYIFIPPASIKLKWGVYWYHLVRLSVCGHNCVRSVSSTMFIWSIIYLHIPSSILRRCVACNARNFCEFFKFVTLTLSSFDLGSNMTQWYR